MQDQSHRVPISACNNIPAHRPLSIYVQLDQLYGSTFEEDDGSHSSEYPRVIVEPSLENRNVDEQMALNETKRNRSMLVYKSYFHYSIFHKQCFISFVDFPLSLQFKICFG